jgi:hypothetical protein
MQLKLVLWLVGAAVSRHDSLLRERENLKFQKGLEKKCRSLVMSRHQEIEKRW